MQESHLIQSERDSVDIELGTRLVNVATSIFPLSFYTNKLKTMEW